MWDAHTVLSKKWYAHTVLSRTWYVHNILPRTWDVYTVLSRTRAVHLAREQHTLLSLASGTCTLFTGLKARETRPAWITSLPVRLQMHGYWLGFESLSNLTANCSLIFPTEQNPTAYAIDQRFLISQITLRNSSKVLDPPLYTRKAASPLHT